MNTVIKKGTALVLVGDGNEQKACELAASQGRYVQIPADCLESPFTSWPDDADTVIVHMGSRLSPFAADKLKAMVSNKTMRVERLGEPPKTMTTPNFILCADRKDVFRFAGDRRYHVVHL